MADHFRLHVAALLVLLAGSSLGLTTSRGENARDGSSVWGITVFLNDVFFPKEDAITFKPVPPPHTEVARMARYILHQSEWTSMATHSSRMPGYPTANVFSVSDGPINNSSGIPYFYLSAWELSSHDLKKNNKASLTMSLAQGDYCTKNEIDPEDPTCAHVIFTGTMKLLGSDDHGEAEFAKEALFSRHPAMEGWPPGHEWSFAKMDIEDIMLLDFYGGVKHIDIKEYFKATPF